MAHAINKENLIKLFAAIRDDAEMTGLVYEQIKKFETYHQAVFDMEIWTKLYSYDNLPRKVYQSRLTELDIKRANCHNLVLDAINILNRIASQHDIPAIYDGKVSKEQPHRREAADAVFGYIENVILKRK